MDFPMQFIMATEDYCTFERYIPAPLIRKSFFLDEHITEAKIIICGLGFYELYINGSRISKLLAPYISAPDDIFYYDMYDIAEFLQTGENAIGIVLGNGMQNSFGGYVWDFHKASWRGVPKTALRMDIKYENGETFTQESGEDFLTSPSPIYFDDLRCGEYYDARKEQLGWNTCGFDDSSWTPVRKAPVPKGKPRLCEADPIVVTKTIKPVSITAQGDGYLYDFGENCAGVCHLTIRGDRGQTISMEHGEHLINGELNLKNIQFEPDGFVQKDIYILRGGEIEEYIPRFTYHGFQYVLVKGISKEQAESDILSYLVMNSDLREMGGFHCSDETANTLQTLTRRSSLANFYYFPTDCPHREKNGWTGDAAVSAEHMLLNLSPEKSYIEWLRNICKAQNEAGTIPGIVPTGGWGFHWGNGPAWDAVLTYLPYYTYIYRGDKSILEENATAIFRYLHYLSVSIRSDGLLALGLGDWCPPGRGAGDYKSPIELTDSIISMDICNKASFIFDVLEWNMQKEFAQKLASKLRGNIREKLIDLNTMTAAGNCQTSQSMALFYDVFNEDEKPEAFKKLLSIIEENDGHMDTGILGARVIFHVLSSFGESGLAFNMITRSDFPSYGNWVARGATSLWEDFQPEGGSVSSLNHHFFGDISGWFIKCITGIQYNPSRNNHDTVKIAPSFIDALDYAEGFHIAPNGKIEVKWKRTGEDIEMNITLPENMTVQIALEKDWIFEETEKGHYICKKQAF